MKRFMILSLVIVSALTILACASEKAAAPPAEKKAEPAAAAGAADMDDAEFIKKASYALGMQVAESYKRMDVTVDIDEVIAGLRDGYAEKSKMTQEEARNVMSEFRMKVREMSNKKREAQQAVNAKEGVAFLEANKAKPGVITTESGLQYTVLTEGTGASPTGEDTVKVHYKGTLLDGTEFDSSYSRGQPATFKVTGVIKGWTEALQLMKVGGKNKLFIPSELAYGERGAGRDIGPNAALVFEVELLEIVESAK